MTNAEFTAWERHTARSENGWQLDEAMLHNRHEHLMYHGGENGTYVWVIGTTVQVGKYDGAIPHIGEASFIERGSKRFDTKDEAFSAVANATGISGLMALLTGDGRNPLS